LRVPANPVVPDRAHPFEEIPGPVPAPAEAVLNRGTAIAPVHRVPPALPAPNPDIVPDGRINSICPRGPGGGSRIPSIFRLRSNVKLKQAQIWQVAGGYLRIVRLERLAVEYKSMPKLTGNEGTHHHATKKEFCRLLKGATLVEIKGPVPPLIESID
jgi:hypothetical protein